MAKSFWTLLLSGLAAFPAWSATFESKTKVIDDAKGGVITFSDQTSVTIPHGLFGVNTRVTAAYRPALYKQPPNRRIIGIGPVLAISFKPHPGVVHEPGIPGHPETIVSGDFMVALDFSKSKAHGYEGSLPIAGVRTGKEEFFIGLNGQVDMIHRIVIATIEPATIAFMKSHGHKLSDWVLEIGVVNMRKAAVVSPESARQSGQWGEALAWMKEGCDEGEAKACTVLGSAFTNGQGVPKNDAQAAALFQKACAGGDAEGCAALGSAYAHGQGVAKDAARATKLLEKACVGGFAKACAVLKPLGDE